MYEQVSENTQAAAAPADLGQENQSTVQARPGQGAPFSGEKKAEPAAQPKERDLNRDAAFARMRRETDEAKREADRIRKQVQANQQSSQPLDTQNQERNTAWGERIQRLEKENRMMREREYERIYSRDLSRIKEAYPSLAAKDVSDLGSEFFKLRAVGVDPVVAYDALKAKEAREQKPTPEQPSTTGSAKSGGAAQKDYYSPEDVDRLTAKDLSNEKLLETVIKSMKKWRK